MIPDEDEFDFVENGINKSLYMSRLDCDDPFGQDEYNYELRVVSLDYDDPFDDIDRKENGSIIQLIYTNKFGIKTIDNCEGFSSKAKCRKRYNGLVRRVKDSEREAIEEYRIKMEGHLN